MLWALLISLILRKQMNNIKSSTTCRASTDYTPGFYTIEIARLTKYAGAMEQKLKSAIANYDETNATWKKMIAKNKPQRIQSRAFMRLCAADNNVTKAREKCSMARNEIENIHQISDEANKIINTAYDLAYSSKIGLLKYELSLLRSR